MAERDYIGRLLQILRIKSPVDAISGDDIISVETKMQYNSLFPITEDGDIIYKAYIDSIVSVPLEFDQSNLTEIGSGDSNFYLTITGVPSGFIPDYSMISYSLTEKTQNNSNIVMEAGIWKQYSFTNNSTQTIKVYLVKE